MSGDLTLRAISAHYGRREVLTNICAAVPAGSFSTLLGPNGAGKSTLLKLIAGIVPAAGGSIQLGDRELLSQTPLQRARQVAYVPQLQSSSMPMTVLESLNAARYPWRRGAAAEGNGGDNRIEPVLSQLRLRESAGSPVSTLSGGEWRRLMIAQGLVQLEGSNGVLLLDEPIAFLDPPARLEILLILRGLTDAGMTVIAVLHELHLARAWADYVLLLRAGTLTAAGTPAEVLTVEALCELYGCRPQELLLAGITQ